MKLMCNHLFFSSLSARCADLEEHEGCMNRSLQESGVCIYQHHMNFMLEKAEADRTYVNDVHENKRRLVKVACRYVRMRCATAVTSGKETS